MTVAALVLAAGRGERLGQALPKAYVPLAGRALILHSIEKLASVPELEAIVPVIGASDRSRFDALGLGAQPKLQPPVVGGAERQDSVGAGLAALPPDVQWVAVHDAARCLVAPEAVSRVIAAAKAHGAALLAAPVRDTIKRAREGRVVETPPREECLAAQTPQVFRVDLLREALAKAAAEGFTGTDDAQLVERLGVAVHVVLGDASNWKITLPQDLAAAEAWLRENGEEGDGIG
ncbi:MAG: 2-C-methyl-D-erythritol 4-phosphate cytidylyltransferase [Proteobacteria bacterium]|nr:2-C-methyl-D-erythritol 4-phosphate cytidylyltransferase [Pseudomonadota bacterium]